MREETADTAYASPVDQLLVYGECELGDEWPDYLSLGLGEQHVPELIRMIEDERLHSGGRDTLTIWASVHGWRALGQLKAVDAVGALLSLLRRIDEEDDDWVGEELPEVMAMIGAGAIEGLSLYLKDRRNGLFARVAAESSLCLIGKEGGSVRDRCVTILTDELKYFFINDSTLNAFLIDGLTGLNALESLDCIREAFAYDKVDCSVQGDLEDVEIALGVKAKRTYPRRSLRPGDHDEVPEPKTKIGRNEPCYCGSGKKYKKCCMAKDDAVRTPVPLDLTEQEIKEAVKASEKYPLRYVLVNEDWEERAFATVMVIRAMGASHYIFGVYLIDLQCLGVKQASYGAGLTRKQIDVMVMHYPGVMDDFCIGCAQRLVNQAVAYAQNLGFDPHPDFEVARHVLGEKDEDCKERVFKFGGPDGKPLFMAGPEDDPQAIIDKLTARLGKDGFSYILPT